MCKVYNAIKDDGSDATDTFQSGMFTWAVGSSELKRMYPYIMYIHNKS